MADYILKSVVETIFTGKERVFNRRFMVFANHYVFEPVACKVAHLPVHHDLDGIDYSTIRSH